MRPFFLAAALALHGLSTIALAADGAPESGATREYLLDNGLKLVVRQDHRAPVIVSQIWYKVGGSYEQHGTTGVSHVLEHMMFKGTERLAPGEFSRIIAENGGRENAFTGRDFTAYFQQLESSRLPISFELEADRMRNLLLPEEEFAREIEVVKEERRLRTDDNPRSLVYEQLNAAAWVASPYQNPIIGWMDDLDNMTVEDLRAWYERWYAPNNATLVVVGDVDPDEVHALAKRYFGPVEPADVGKPKPRVEPPQMGERRVTVRAPAQLPYVLMGYKVPVLRTADKEWEPYALEVLAGVLDGGESARLSRRLVREQGVAASAGARYGLYSRHAELLMLDGTPANGRDAAELEAALRAEVELLREALVDETELARIKAQVVAANVYERDSIFYQAMLIGMLETVDLNWRLAEEYVERVQAVTPEQVREVARRYLVDDRLTVAVLDPQPIDGGEPFAPPVTEGGAIVH